MNDQPIRTTPNEAGLIAIGGGDALPARFRHPFRTLFTRNDAVAQSSMVNSAMVGQASSLSRTGSCESHGLAHPGNAGRLGRSSTSCRVPDRLEACPTAWFRLILILLAWLTILVGVGQSAENLPTGAAKKLPKLPWHLADVWWSFEEVTPHFESLEVDVTIDRDVPSTVNLYIAPCGLGELSGIKFYGGLQSNINGWQSRTNPTRVHLGAGGIFSRWGKKNLSVEQARGAEDSHYEAAGYEGDFVSVRRPFAWTKGTYTWSLRALDVEQVNGTNATWIGCFITSQATGEQRFIGSLRFEGSDLIFWSQHAAFVEVYSTAKIPRSEIPEVKVTFGYPRINGRWPKLKGVRVVHPGPGQSSGSPDCATAVADGSNVVVTVGPIFEREAKDRRYPLSLKEPVPQESRR